MSESISLQMRDFARQALVPRLGRHRPLKRGFAVVQGTKALAAVFPTTRCEDHVLEISLGIANLAPALRVDEQEIRRWFCRERLRADFAPAYSKKFLGIGFRQPEELSHFLEGFFEFVARSQPAIDCSSTVEPCARIRRTRPSLRVVDFPTEIERLTTERLVQQSFRRGVEEIWGYRCAVTGLSVRETLRASHVKRGLTASEATNEQTPSTDFF
jgi:hypothetical protein